MVAYFLSAYIRVPVLYQYDNIWNDYLKEILVGDGDASKFGLSTASVPEIDQLISGAILIYLWGDSTYER